MKPVAPDTLLENLSWRYAVKKFDPSKAIPADTWNALERAALLAPSSYGLQPWRFVVVRDPALRVKLREVSWNQPQITDASHLLVLARKATMTPADVDRYVDRIVEVRGGDRAALADFRGMMLGTVTSPTFNADVWTARQVYIALGFFLASAAQLGVDACPMEGFDAEAYDRILNLPAQGYKATVVATAGYRASDDWLAGLAKVRFPAEQVFDRR